MPTVKRIEDVPLYLRQRDLHWGAFNMQPHFDSLIEKNVVAPEQPNAMDFLGPLYSQSHTSGIDQKQVLVITALAQYQLGASCKCIRGLAHPCKVLAKT